MKKTALAIVALLAITTIFSFTVAPMRLVQKHTISFSTFGVSGVFKKFGGTIAFDERDLAGSRFEVAIDINSIKTSFALQDKHAKGEDWFDAAKHPLIRFNSKRIVKAGSSYQAIGNLQVHGITKEIALPFTYKKSANGGTFEGSFTINRNDFKIGEPGGMVGDEVKVKVSVPVIK
ncbi:MAG: YceI family protein [Segetibacter sp.]|nr:YceI family protein [Segetibacter sp.]